MVKSRAGAMLDFGGIAKGYAADRAGEIARSFGVSSGLIDIGGNHLFLGDKGGSPFRVGVADPRPAEHGSALFGVLALRDTSAVSSGDFERYFVEDGVRYCHILDKNTGAPAPQRAVHDLCGRPGQRPGPTPCPPPSSSWGWNRGRPSAKRTAFRPFWPRRTATGPIWNLRRSLPPMPAMRSGEEALRALRSRPPFRIAEIAAALALCLLALLFLLLPASEDGTRAVVRVRGEIVRTLPPGPGCPAPRSSPHGGPTWWWSRTAGSLWRPPTAPRRPACALRPSLWSVSASSAPPHFLTVTVEGESDLDAII